MDLSYVVKGGLLVAGGLVLSTGVAAQSFTPGQDGSDAYNVAVNIEVEEEVSVWAADENVALILDGKNPENSDVFVSGLNHINNVAAEISATVSGPGGAATGLPAGEINFFIFEGGNENDAYAAIASNSNNPAGALVWNSTNLTDEKLFKQVPTSTSVDSIDVMYAASAPNTLPEPDDFDLELVWTIAATP